VRLSPERKAKLAHFAALYALAVQFVLSGLILISFNLLEVLGRRPDLLFGFQLWQLVLLQTVAVAGFAAPMGIQRGKAWGYFAEIPVVATVTATFGLWVSVSDNPHSTKGSDYIMLAILVGCSIAPLLSKGRGIHYKERRPFSGVTPENGST